MTSPEGPFTVHPIGVARTPFPDRASAPRQPAAARGVPGRIELLPDGRFEHALEDLGSFRHLWVLSWFHLSEGFRPKVRPPRSELRRGVFATRAPHRPNPIGMSVLRLDRIDGLTLHVLDVDLVDGTPVLDLKPYLPYTDAIPEAGHGWVGAPAAADPGPSFEISAAPRAAEQLAFLSARGIDLWDRARTVLEAGPAPHPYRRIRKEGEGFVLAVRDFRFSFRVDGTRVTVERIRTGYRRAALEGRAPELAVHREFAERFGLSG